MKKTLILASLFLQNPVGAQQNIFNLGSTILGTMSSPLVTSDNAYQDSRVDLELMLAARQAAVDFLLKNPEQVNEGDQPLILRTAFNELRRFRKYQDLSTQELAGVIIVLANGGEHGR